MRNAMQLRSLISWARRRITAAALTLASLLLPVGVTAQSFGPQILVHTFTGSPDGGIPNAPLVRSKSGAFYGTTEGGGVFGYGTVFKLDRSRITVLHRFNGFNGTFDGKTPEADLFESESGNLYGTTAVGGASNYGTVFKLDAYGRLTTLHSFTGGTEGGEPTAGVVRDSAGNLYGTTWIGDDLSCGGNGIKGCGVVFKIDVAGTLSVLHSFTGAPDGAYPIFGDLVRDAVGNLYGTTGLGGVFNAGTIFKIDEGGNEAVLHSFSGGLDGKDPEGGLVMEANGSLFGTTDQGGAYGYGMVFKLDGITAAVTALHSFGGIPDGAYPTSRLALDRKGNLYGTTTEGGTGACYIWSYQIGCGTVFTIDTAGNETVLFSFTGGADGNSPFAGVTLDGKAGLYGTTAFGGLENQGSVFKLMP